MMATFQTVSEALDAQRNALVNEYVSRAWRMWQSLTPADFWNDAVTQGVSAYITQQQIAFVKQMRRLGISYANTMLGMVGVTGGTAQVPEYVVVRDNTDPWKVSARPADAYRSLAVKTPDIRPHGWDDLNDAVYETVQSWLDAAERQLTDNALTDGVAAQNRASEEYFKASGIKRFRRIIHPELSKTGTCGLCVVAATNVFSRSDLMPMHNRCKCTVAPIRDNIDPGLQLNSDDLQKIYDAASMAGGGGSGTSARNLTQLRVSVRNDSEVGPILTRSDWKQNDDAPEWRMPDTIMTQRQMRRMYERATVFNAKYAELLNGSADSLSFRYDGRSYTFRKDVHVKQAWDYVRSMLSYSRGWLGLAA